MQFMNGIIYQPVCISLFHKAQKDDFLNNSLDALVQLQSIGSGAESSSFKDKGKTKVNSEPEEQT